MILNSNFTCLVYSFLALRIFSMIFSYKKYLKRLTSFISRFNSEPVYVIKYYRTSLILAKRRTEKNCRILIAFPTKVKEKNGQSIILNV